MLSLKKWMTEVTDALKADYVIEQGTTGIWTYRKWNSGIAECWGFYQASGLTITSSSAGTYYGGEAYIDLPSFFQTTTCVTYGNAPSQNSGVYIYSANPLGTRIGVNYRAHASVSNASCGSMFHVMGTWK